MNEFLENMKNKFEIFKEKIIATEFYSNLNDFEKKVIGLVALTPGSIFLLFEIMKKYEWEKKKELVESLVYNPEKAHRKTFSINRAHVIEKKLTFLEPRHEYKKSIKILEIIQDTYYEDFPNVRRSVYPTDFALIYYNLKYPEYIPVSFDDHVNDGYLRWLKTKTKLLSELLPVIGQKLDTFSCIYPFQIKPNGKYMLDSDVLISYHESDDRAIETRQMLSQVIKDGTIDLCVIPTVIEEISDKGFYHTRFPDLDVFYEKYKKNREKYKKKRQIKYQKY